MKEKILLINPPIHDFAAYNLWARPLGILYIASLLKKIGFKIDYIDCLSLEYEKLMMIKNNKIIKSKMRKFSTFHYFKEEIKKPEVYKNIKRKYYRFGISPEVLEYLLLSLEKPKVVLITSIMTYWYRGVFEAIKVVKKVFPDVPVILGGIYAILCTEHAEKFSGADIIIKDNNILEFIKILCNIFDKKAPVQNYYSIFKNNLSNELLLIYPALDEYKENNFLPLSTSFGCIYKCKYCASCYLQKKYIERTYIDIFKEIKYWAQSYKFNDIAFYDDALLFNKEIRIKPFLKDVINSNFKLNFHTPNGVHIKFIDKELAYLMKESGFKTLRFGFESIIKKFQNDSDNKVTNKDFENAVKILFDAGFTRENIGIYILMGLPGQPIEDVKKTIKFIKELNLKPKLCEYSPIPHTEYFYRCLKFSKTDIYNEPLFHNNTALSLWSSVFTEGAINELKTLCKR